MYFEKKIYKLLTEEDVMDKMIKYKDEDGNEKEATVGGIIKKGEDHPAHDLAKKELDKSKGKEKAKPKAAKIDANPFDKADDQADDMKSADAQAEKDKEDVRDSIDGTIEGIGDAVSRGLDYDDPDVAQMVDKDLQAAFQAGADDDDILNMAKELDPAGREILQQALGNMGIEDINVTDVGSSSNKPNEDDDDYEPNRQNADNAKKELADISVDLETHEGDIPKSVKRQVDQYTQDIMAQQGIYKNDDGKFATDDGKVLSSDSVENILSRETGRSENEIGYMLDKAGLSPGDDESDSDDTDYDSDFYSDVEDVDPDKGISDAVKGIRPEARERAFDMIIQGFDDDYDLKEMYKNLKNGKMPNPKEDSFGAIQHLILKQGIEEGSIDYGSDGMELANYLETREEDLYDQMMDPDQYDEIQEVKKLFKKRAGI
mgnify:CR=1 FL=1